MLEFLKEAVVKHCSRSGGKLRRPRLTASHPTLFISTSRFRQNPEESHSGGGESSTPLPC